MESCSTDEKNVCAAMFVSGGTDCKGVNEKYVVMFEYKGMKNID